MTEQPIDPPHVADQPTPASAAPPSIAGKVMSAKRPANWPSVIGIIAIVLGSCASVGGLFTACSVLFYDVIAKIVPDPSTLQVARDWASWTVGSGVVSSLLAIVLLVGGIQLLRRRPQAVLTLRIWAVLKVILAVVSSVMGVIIQQQQAEITAAQLAKAGPGMPFGSGWINAFAMVGMLFSCLWLLALPAFLLVWFQLRSVKADIAGWNRQSAH